VFWTSDLDLLDLCGGELLRLSLLLYLLDLEDFGLGGGGGQRGLQPLDHCP